MQLEAGDIIIVGGGTDWLSKLIYWGSSTRTQECLYSHTMLGAGVKVADNTKTAELTFGADALVMLGKWIPENYGRYIVYGWSDPVAKNVAASYVDELFDKLNGQPYGAEQYLYFAWRRLCNILALPPRLAIHQWFSWGYICTTVVNMEIRHTAKVMGYEINYPYGDGAMTPLDIVNVCNKLVLDKHLIEKAKK